ncbi:MAG TPA: DUF6544 family protein [Nocardioidaceae bacterium]
MALHRPAFHHSEHDLARLFSQGPHALRHAWVLATTVGETVGFVVPALVAVVAFDLPAMVTLLLMVLAGAVEGALLGTAQAVVLGREFLGFSRSAWIGATSGGAAAAWFLGMLPSTLHSLWEDWPLAVLVPLAVVLGLGVLISIGFAQWTVLRRHVARSRTWVPANAVAWAVGLGLMLLVSTPLWQEGQSSAVAIGVGVLGGLVMAVTVAVLTGVWLARLVRPRPLSATRRLPAGVPVDDWTALGSSTDDFRVFDPGLVEGLPDPVQRWLVHAITPGTALLTGVELEWTGHVRLGGSWRPFYARQRTRLDGGFVWTATTRLGGLPVTGFDRYTHDEGQMSWRMLRTFRVMSASGDETTRSAAGRQAVELLASLPAAALDPTVEWRPVDHRQATALLTVGGERHAVTVTVDLVGRLREVELDRWGTPPGLPFDRYRFGAVLGEERRYDGYLVPTQVVGGWHFGTDRWAQGAFLRGRVVRCSFH